MDFEMSDVMVDTIEGGAVATSTKACLIGGPCYSTKCWTT